jgi:hypothetical protein
MERNSLMLERNALLTVTSLNQETVQRRNYTQVYIEDNPLRPRDVAEATYKWERITATAREKWKMFHFQYDPC